LYPQDANVATSKLLQTLAKTFTAPRAILPGQWVAPFVLLFGVGDSANQRIPPSTEEGKWTY
jgi:hypothetical protein